MLSLPKTSNITHQQTQGVFISLQDWQHFVLEYQNFQKINNMRTGLKDAFQEVKDIQAGKKAYTTMNDFLNEY